MKQFWATSLMLVFISCSQITPTTGASRGLASVDFSKLNCEASINSKTTPLKFQSGGAAFSDYYFGVIGTKVFQVLQGSNENSLMVGAVDGNRYEVIFNSEITLIQGKAKFEATIAEKIFRLTCDRFN